ncbi:xylulokinase (plasmid) [Coraliomargarita sp. W4R53]
MQIRDEPRLCVGVDIGTSGCKVSVIDASARIVAEGHAGYPSNHPHAGWVEQNPEDWVAAAFTACAEALESLAAPQRAAIAAIAFSAPTHVAVLVGDDGAPLRPAIMWNDQRSAAQAVELARINGEHIAAVTANSPTPTWTLAHLRWIAENEPAVLEATRRVWFMKDWVRSRFTSDPRFCTDRVDAQGALLLDVRSHKWDPVLVESAGLALDSMPEIVEPTTVVGTLATELATRWGLEDIAVTVGTTDTAAELLAAGLAKPGDTAIKIATAGNVAIVANDRPTDGRIICYEHVVAGVFYWNSATSAAAASLRWLAESMLVNGGPVDFAEIDHQVADTVPGADGLLFTPYLNGERSPRFDPAHRATFAGLSARHSWPHFARAVMEGVAFSLRDAAALYSTPLPATLALIGGGARSSQWPTIVADVLDRDIAVLSECDSSVGAALVACVSVGVLPTLIEAAHVARGRASRFVKTRPDQRELYDARFADYLELADMTAEISHRLGQR